MKRMNQYEVDDCCVLHKRDVDGQTSQSFKSDNSWNHHIWEDSILDIAFLKANKIIKKK